jgi:group I intron endonuclease
MIIYKATSNTTGKSYIGQTWRPFKERKAEHMRAAANIKFLTNPTVFNSALSMQGTADFDWEVLEVCDSAEHCNEREKFYIKLLNTIHPEGYNSTPGGTGMDSTMSETMRNKIASSMVLVHTDPEYQARVYPKLKGLTPPNKGIPMSDQQKAKVSAAKKAVYADPTYINPNIGQKRTGEALKNLQDGHSKRIMPTGEAWTEAHGNQYTEEVREKMRQAKLNKKPANTRQIECIETGEIFAGLTEAAEKLQLPRQSIWMNIKGKVKKVGKKYTFRYTDVKEIL